MKTIFATLPLALCLGCGSQSGFQTTSTLDSTLTAPTKMNDGASSSTPATSGSTTGSTSGSTSDSASNGGSGSGARTPQSVPKSEPLTSVVPAPAFKICSKLPFASSVTFPKALSATDDEAFKLALNMSGSFEGETGWSNLTNNFDGEGLSMGLLNQTLGTGSLEPLLVQMRDNYSTAMSNAMETTREKSFVGMINTWAGVAKVESMVREQSAPVVPDDSQALSPLDIESNSGPAVMASEFVVRAAAAPLIHSNSTAVSWAKANLYASNGKFLAGWETDLNNLTSSPEYVSVQLTAAEAIHTKAIALEKQVGCKDLRCYLLMFDFVVQNGGLYSADLTDFATWVKANANATEIARLKEIVTLRLRHVRSEFVSDVQTRKLAIINGTGTVHGEARNFPKEYCFAQTTAYPQ